MEIRVRGRVVSASATPMRGGYFFRCPHTDAFWIGLGTEVMVNGEPYTARHILRFPAGEPEVPGRSAGWFEGAASRPTGFPVRRPGRLADRGPEALRPGAGRGSVHPARGGGGAGFHLHRHRP